MPFAFSVFATPFEIVRRARILLARKSSSFVARFLPSPSSIDYAKSRDNRRVAGFAINFWSPRSISNFIERRNIERLRFRSRKSLAFVSSFRMLAMGRRNFDRLEIRRSSAVSFLIPKMGDESSWLLVTLNDRSAMDIFSSIGK